MFKNLLQLVKQSRSAIARKILPELLFYSSRINLFPQEFVTSSHKFLQFLKNSDLFASNAQGETVGIVIMPWVSTAVPWYSLTIAIGLAKRGKHIVLIWDDTCFPEPSVVLRLQNLCIGNVIDYLSRFFPVIRLSLEKDLPNREDDRQHLKNLANLNLIWSSRAESVSSPDLDRLSIYQNKLSQNLPLIRGLLSRLKFDYLVVPGGVYSSSSLFMYVSQEIGIRVATYDGGGGGLCCCTNGIAAHQSDIPRAFAKLWNSNDEIKQKVIALAKEEFQSRKECKDHLSIQVLKTSQQKVVIPTDVLIPLNLEWDAAALGKHHLFENTIDWLLQTVNFILSNSSKSVVVRQHPAERLPSCESFLGIEKILNQHFGFNERFYFINATQEVNSYNLLESSSLVIPFVSSIGLEAAAMGKNVLVSGDAYYKNLGFVWSANSRQEYFDLIDKGLKDSLSIFPDQQNKAWICYYLTQLCNLPFTQYNADLQDFSQWGYEVHNELFSDSIIADLLTAIDENIPFSWLRHCSSISNL